MPEFLPDFVTDLDKKKKEIIDRYKDSTIIKLYDSKFKLYWNDYDVEEIAPVQDVVAVDGSLGAAPTANGGFFYACRGLALGREKRYKAVEADFDFGVQKDQSEYIGRVMEHTEHLAPLKAIDDECLEATIPAVLSICFMMTPPCTLPARFASVCVICITI